MVTVRADLQECDLVAGGDLQADVSKGRVHVTVKDDASILRGADRVVQQDRDVVALVNIGAHALR